ncbi:hypothetical protein [uncultured Tateyamaria sp.]|uniref:hypothetical protein n=1 Tax=uncultured Tateyamaria sp. TaxID=455651 RepID=UPI0026270FC1|nr:hypothetical protein [uncultured Tateyamaria sp.]
MPQHGPKKTTFLGCTTAKKNPGIQEGKTGVHVTAGDAIADPWDHIAERGRARQAFLGKSTNDRTRHRAF